MKCPKCSYERTPVDKTPDYECPKCGIIYNKYRPPDSSKTALKKSIPSNDEENALKTKDKNLSIPAWVVPIFIGLVVGYFSGREHIKYELRQTLHSAAEGIIKSFDKTINATQEKQNKAKPQPNINSSQNNAIRSAKNYLGISGFSRIGLIKQLSSDAGDGYSIADATVAVDSLNIDWNNQAVRSAKQYLGISGFSCKGLIEQLSSEAGDGYTASQATFGAQQAGAC